MLGALSIKMLNRQASKRTNERTDGQFTPPSLFSLSFSLFFYNSALYDYRPRRDRGLLRRTSLRVASIWQSGSWTEFSHQAKRRRVALRLPFSRLWASRTAMGSYSSSRWARCAAKSWTRERRQPSLRRPPRVSERRRPQAKRDDSDQEGSRVNSDCICYCAGLGNGNGNSSGLAASSHVSDQRRRQARWQAGLLPMIGSVNGNDNDKRQGAVG